MRTPAALALSALLILSGCEDSQPEASVPSDGPQPVAQVQPAAQPQQQADSRTPPDFTLPEVMSGKDITLSAYKGKVVLLDFWATWCGPCRMEIPHFVELQDQYKSKGLRILGVSLDQQGIAVVKPFMKQWKVNYDMVIDSSGEVNMAYGGIRSIPTALLIGKDGKVIDVFVGYRPKEVFEEAIKKAL